MEKTTKGILDSLKKITDQHEIDIQNIIEFNKTTMNLMEQQVKANQYLRQRLDSEGKKLAELMKFVSDSVDRLPEQLPEERK